MLEISLSKPPARSCRNCLLRPARLNQRVSWKTATRDVRGALASSKCPARKKPVQPSVNSMARNSADAQSKSMKLNRARIAAAASAAMAAADAGNYQSAVSSEQFLCVSHGGLLRESVNHGGHKRLRCRPQ